MHETMGMVHLDIKPENLYETSAQGDDTFVKMGDLGLSCKVPPAAAPSLALQTDSLLADGPAHSLQRAWERCGARRR